MGIVGVVDRVTNDQVDGWAYRDDNHAEHLRVTVQLRGTSIGSYQADQFREDLQQAEIGEGDHAYLINLDRQINPDELDELIVLASSKDGEQVQLPLPGAHEFVSANGESEIRETEEAAPEAPAKDGLEEAPERTARFLMPYAAGAELLPPVGQPADFIDDQILVEWAAITRMSPKELRERLRGDTIPIPHSDNRERYADGDDLIYWLSGWADHQLIEDLSIAYGVKGGRYLDFGGSTGRVFRHFARQKETWDVWSCDFNRTSVEFNLKYFPSNVRVFLNTSVPPLPLPDAYFDLVSACSVFTHMDETETGWLLELRRVLRVGGVACVSIHSKETWARMSGELRDDVLRFRPDIAHHTELPEGKTVVTFRDDDPYRCHTFHSDDYIDRNWGRFFEICEIRPLVLGLQAIVVCRRVD